MATLFQPILERTGQFLLWCFLVLWSVGVVALIVWGVYSVFANAAPSFVTGVVGAADTLHRFGMPSVADLAGNAGVGALVGLIIGTLRFRQRRQTALAERVVEILGEPDLLSFRKLGVATILGHVAAGVAAGAILAWIGFPPPSATCEFAAFRQTPLVSWVVAAGAGFDGGGGCDFGGTPWPSLIWFAIMVALLCAFLTSLVLAAGTLVASSVAGSVFSASRATTLALALGLARALPDHPLRSGHVFMHERVNNALARDDGRRVMLCGAIFSGAATGFVTAAIEMWWAPLASLL